MNFVEEVKEIKIDFVEELRWRRMLHTIMPGTAEKLKENTISGYIGFDPTADSLHVGSLAQIMILIHFQRAGHKPFVLVGGATGMVGDPSGKSDERNLLSEDVLQHNLQCIKKQLKKFLNFESGDNKAELVNNYDWFKKISFLSFIRDIGKHITINYMMSKDSVKKRIKGKGMSFTEFTYQLVQGYDFYHLWENENCVLQMGGSDQWGNIVTGTELIRRKGNGKAYALTTNLITKSDGTKFGKTEGGNIWLDSKKTSPYEFYQFWYNTSDVDAKSFIKIFTLLERKNINALIKQHNISPHKRILQKSLAEDITKRVHGVKALELINVTNEFIFNKLYKWEDLIKFRYSESQFLNIFKSSSFFVMGDWEPIFENDLLYFLTEIRNIDKNSGGAEKMFESKSEAKKLILNGGVYINKTKVSTNNNLSDFRKYLNKYLFVQKGKSSSALVVFCSINEVDSEINRIKGLLNFK